MPSGQITFFQLLVPETRTFTIASLMVTTAATGKHMPVAIYNTDSENHPTTVAADLGIFSLNAIANLQNSFSVSLPAGQYLIAIQPEATWTTKCMTLANCIPVFGYPFSTGSGWGSLGFALKKAQGYTTTWADLTSDVTVSAYGAAAIPMVGLW
jgi:hypothetical protein